MMEKKLHPCAQKAAAMEDTDPDMILCQSFCNSSFWMIEIQRWINILAVISWDS